MNNQEEYVKISLQRYEELKAVRDNTINETERFKRDLLDSNKAIMKLIGDFLKIHIKTEGVNVADMNPTYGLHFQQYLKLRGYSIETRGDSFIITKEQ